MNRSVSIKRKVVFVIVRILTPSLSDQASVREEDEDVPEEEGEETAEHDEDDPDDVDRVPPLTDRQVVQVLHLAGVLVRGERAGHQLTGAGRHDGDVEPRHQEHQGDVLVEYGVQEPPFDQAVGEDEAGNTERTEQQAELTELEHLWTKRLLSHTVSIYLLSIHVGWLSGRKLPKDVDTSARKMHLRALGSGS